MCPTLLVLQVVSGQSEAFPMHAVLQEFDQNYAATMTAEAYARSAVLSCSCARIFLARYCFSL